MIRRPTRYTRSDTLLPYTTLFRSGRTVAVVVIIDRRLSVVVVAVAVPIGVTVGAAGKGDGGEDENKMSEHGGVPCLSVLQHRPRALNPRSEEHTSELQSLMRISYAVLCLQKKRKSNHTIILT